MESKLYGATANSLNDPFELQPAAFNDIDFDDDSGLAQFLGIASSRLPETLKGREAGYYQERGRAQMDIQREQSRIISFSDRYDSPLLWAHYANSYRGACLHFIGGKLSTMASRQGTTGKVRYADQRPMYPLSLALNLSIGNLVVPRSTRSARAESNKITFFTKASDWSYEKEYRTVYDTRDMTNFEFSPRSFASIIVGPRMPPKDVNKLITLVDMSPYKRVPIRRAVISSSSFAVQIDWETRLNIGG